jgi:hypothetical protein
MLVVVSVIMGIGQLARGEEPSRRDQLRIAVQEICPVSGEKLGEHAPPIKVKVGEETVFVCCEGCLKGKIDAQHWATIHANFARAQGICPVMKKPLPAKPKWTIVEGQIVFVCCPPCGGKITADPETYLRQIDEQYTASLETRRAAK